LKRGSILVGSRGQCRPQSKIPFSSQEEFKDSWGLRSGGRKSKDFCKIKRPKTDKNGLKSLGENSSRRNLEEKNKTTTKIVRLSRLYRTPGKKRLIKKTIKHKFEFSLNFFKIFSNVCYSCLREHLLVMITLSKKKYLCSPLICFFVTTLLKNNFFVPKSCDC